MRALVNSPDSPAGIELREVHAPEPGPDEALVEVRAAGINRGELTLLSIRPDGWRPGQDTAGVVIRAAADGSGPAEGTRVVAWVDQAGWAQQVAAPTNRLAELPEGVSFEAAAGLPVAGMTALRTLRLGGQLLGRKVLVTGAAGGVGHLAVQLAARMGAAVTGVSGTPDRAKQLSAIGVPDVVGTVEEARGPFDLVLESVGGESLSTALLRLAPDGLLVLFGNSSKEPSTFRFEEFRGSPRTRIHIFHVYESGERPSFGSDLARLIALVGSGGLVPQVGYAGSWTDPAAAFEALRGRQVFGKTILQID